MSEKLKINRSTVSSGLKKLEEKGYIQTVALSDTIKTKDWYVIDPYMAPYVGLDLEIISIMIDVAALIGLSSKHLLSVYCTLHRYSEHNDKPYIGAIDLAAVYEKSAANNSKSVIKYKILLSFLIETGLITGEWEEITINNSGLKCDKFRIDKVYTILPQNFRKEIRCEEIIARYKKELKD